MSKPSICTRVSRFRRRVHEAVVPCAVSALVGLAMGASATAPSDAATEQATASHVRQYPACAQEDGQLCVFRNQGPGYSFVAGKDRDPSVREDIARFRVRNALADELIQRDNWHPADHIPWADLVHPTRSGQTVMRPGRHAVVSYGPTTYVIDGRLVASS